MATVDKGDVQDHIVIEIGKILFGIGAAKMAADGEHGLEIAAGEPAQSVDIVAVDLRQRTVGFGDVVHPRLGDAGAPGIGTHHHHVPDGAGADHPFRLGEGAVESAHKGDLQLYSVDPGCPLHAAAFLHGHDHGLFAQNVLFGVGGDLAVELGGGGDDHGVDGVGRHHIAIVGIRLVQLLGRHGGSVAHRVADGGDAGIRDGGLEVPGVDQTRPAPIRAIWNFSCVIRRLSL